MSVHLLELPKLKNYLDHYPEKSLNSAVQWSRFFEIKSPSDLEKLAMEQPIFRRAEQALYLISGDPEVRQLAEDREKARVNELTEREYSKQHYLKEGREVGIQEGIQVGLEKGEKDAHLRLILAMIAEGLSSESISKITQMSVSEIDSLRVP